MTARLSSGTWLGRMSKENEGKNLFKKKKKTK